MIPIIHQGLHIRALGQHAPAEDISDASDFIAALAAQNDSSVTPGPAINAEACLVAGMVIPAQPIPKMQQSLPVETSLSEPAFAPNVPSPMPVPTAMPLATPENHTFPATFAPVDIPTAHAPKPELPVAEVESSHPITSPEKPRYSPLAETIAPPVNDITALAAPPQPAQNLSTVTRKPTDRPAGIIAQNPDAAQPVASQSAGPEISARIEPRDQPSAKTAATSRSAIAPTPLDTVATPFQASPSHALLTPTPDRSAAPQPFLPTASLPTQIPSGQTQAAAPPQAPEQHSTSISAAESAWQTRLQVALPLAAVQSVDDGAPPTTDSPSASTSSEAERIDLKAVTASNPPAAVAEAAPTQHPVAPAPRTTVRAQNPTPEADASSNAPPARAAQPATDLLSQQPNPPIPPPHQTLHQTLPAQAPPPALASAVSAQLLPHLAAAKTGAVDVVLQPEELGHVKFQIQQQGDTVRILLSAERPETLDLLRRHSDQLLQEFRQSGFSQAFLNFGQWGQQQRAPAPPTAFAAPLDAEVLEAPPAQRHTPTAAATASGQGLNLRL